MYAIIIYSLIIAGFLPPQSTAMELVTLSSCGPTFPVACSCGREYYEGELQLVVNCTNAGLRNTNLLEHMPKEVQVLIFTGNHIPELPWNVFGTINDYEHLRVVDMSNNRIRDIRGKSYHHVANVERLILNHNELSISRSDDDYNHHHPRVFSNFVNLRSLHLTDAFEDDSSPQLSEDLHDIFVNSHLTKLQKLHLEQNEITHFKDRNVFCDLPSLRDLHLGDNLLSDINFEVNCLNNLRFLDLERNKFEFLKPSDLRLLNELQNRPNRTVNLIVDFNLNPFTCDCRISPLRMWIESTHVNVRNQDNLMCTRPELGAAEHIMKLDMCGCKATIDAASLLFNEASSSSMAADEHRLSLQQPATVASSHATALVFLIATLIAILIGLLIGILYVSRERLSFVITPVLDNVGSKKVQYTSIKDEDCPEVHV